MTIRENIIRLRNEANLTIRQLARRADVSNEYLYKMENGAFENPGIETLRKIAAGLGVSINDLINNDENSIQQTATGAGS